MASTACNYQPTCRYPMSRPSGDTCTGPCNIPIRIRYWCIADKTFARRHAASVFYPAMPVTPGGGRSDSRAQTKLVAVWTDIPFLDSVGSVPARTAGRVARRSALDLACLRGLSAGGLSSSDGWGGPVKPTVGVEGGEVVRHLDTTRCPT